MAQKYDIAKLEEAAQLIASGKVSSYNAAGKQVGIPAPLVRHYCLKVGIKSSAKKVGRKPKMIAEKITIVESEE